MKPLLIELLLITLTVCASTSSHPSESTHAPLDDAAKKGISSDGPEPRKTEEIRLNITLKSDENEKEHVDIDMGKYR
jgi:hypothetical protein